MGASPAAGGLLPSRLELAFALVTISTGSVGLLFNTFHVQLFRTVYALDPAAFAAGHAIYAVWCAALPLATATPSYSGSDALGWQEHSQRPWQRLGSRCTGGPQRQPSAIGPSDWAALGYSGLPLPMVAMGMAATAGAICHCTVDV